MVGSTVGCVSSGSSVQCNQSNWSQETAAVDCWSVVECVHNWWRVSFGKALFSSVIIDDCRQLTTNSGWSVDVKSKIEDISWWMSTAIPSPVTYHKAAMWCVLWRHSWAEEERSLKEEQHSGARTIVTVIGCGWLGAQRSQWVLSISSVAKSSRSEIEATYDPNNVCHAMWNV